MPPPHPTTHTRIESDSLGTVEVPAHVYWGAHTARSLAHFDIGRDTLPPEFIRALGLVNQDLGRLSAEQARLTSRTRSCW
ncbi:MAG: hypothetical protein KGS61_04380 [Verrucomicrobia bacterium]|nr:hypothetical protein [Verrucomicrobiota bacterium]